jgi:hypothetical protein
VEEMLLDIEGEISMIKWLRMTLTHCISPYLKTETGSARLW